MTKKGSQQQRHQPQNAQSSGGCQQLQHQQHQKKDCNNAAAVLAKAGSLEVVSEENFKHRRDGIASTESTCQDCLKERGKENRGKKSRRRKKREPVTKHNSPIIVRLSDSIKVSVKGKMQSTTPKSSDLEESACSTDSEDTQDGSIINGDVNLRGGGGGGQHQQKAVGGGNGGPSSVHNDLRTKAIQGHMRAKVEKNFNAFLSAIQKVHRKDGSSRSYRSRAYKSNLLTERDLTTSISSRKESSSFQPHPQQSPPQLSLLNNFRDYHYSNHSSSGYLPHHPRALKSLDPKNFKFVQNDLHGKVNLEKQDSLEDSESVVSSSTDCHSDLESGNSSSSLDSYTSSAEDLSCEELQYLTDYASGTSLMHFEYPPHECPECLATCHGSYGHYHAAQGGDFFSFEVLDNNSSNNIAPCSTAEQGVNYYKGARHGEHRSQDKKGESSYQRRDDEYVLSERPTYQVTHMGSGQVEVSLADFHAETVRCEGGDEGEQEYGDHHPAGSQPLIIEEHHRHSTTPGYHHSGSRTSTSSGSSSRSKRYNRKTSQTINDLHHQGHNATNGYGISSSSNNNSHSYKVQFDGISLDLTNNSEVTFTVEYHSHDGMVPPMSASTTAMTTTNMFYSSSTTTEGGYQGYQGYNQHQLQQYYSPPPHHHHHHHHRPTHQNSYMNTPPTTTVHYNNHNNRGGGGNNSVDFFHTTEMFNYNNNNHHHYHPSSSSPVGFFPYAVPYYMTPPHFYMCPLLTSIPRPLCVPRDLQCLQSQRLCLIPASEIKTFTASQPPQRPWLPLTHPDNNRPVAIYTVMCYNVLCDKYCTRQLYGYCPSWALVWEYRKKAIMEEIRQYSADIISLQEVETEQFYNFFLPELKRDGYNGIFSPKSRAKTMSENDKKHVDGCAIFYRSTKFSLLKEHLVEFNQLAMSNADGSHDMINRVMTKDNIALAALLETKEAAWENGVPANGGKQPILLATCHIHWDPEFSDVKLIQTMMLMSELKNIIEESGTSLRPGSTHPDSNSIPLLLCGDLNSLPDSGVVEYLSSGKVAADHVDFRDYGYDECLRKLSMTENRELYTHGFRLTQAYEKSVIPYTNYTYDFKGIIDYIFFSRDCMRPLGLLGPLDQDWFREHKVVGCPHPHVPSDHLPLLVEVEMSAPSSSSTAAANNTTATTAAGAGVRR